MERRGDGRDRRTQNLKAIVYGGFRPRRRSNRRAGDDQRYLVDVYDPGIVMVSLAIVLMSCLDAFFTLNLLAMGASEINYFMKTLIESDTSVFLTVKLWATCSGVIILTATAHYRLLGIVRVRRILETLCGIYACLIVWELFLLTAVATGRLA